MDEDALHSVDALVAESVSEVHASPFHHDYPMPSRSSTPSVPPGFGLPHAHPSPTIREEPIAKVQSRIPTVPAPAQFTPPRGIATTHVPRVATPLSTVSVPPTPTPVPAVVVAKPAALAKAQAKEQAKDEIKSLANNTGLSKTIASQASQSFSPQVLQPEDFPVLEKGKAKDVVIPSGPRAMAAGSKRAAATPSSTASVTPALTPSKTPAVKKSTPGILNISVPTQPAAKDVTAKEPASKPVVESSAFPPLPPSTPTASVQSSPAPKGPKTLRVVPTPKTELSSMGPTTPLSAVSNHPATLPNSRQPSIVSNSRLERPSTPASEIISDNASLTSASLSRPSSPPPTRVGSAPVRTTTKSQLKKQRREAMKEKEKSEIEAAAETPDAEEIGPIMGRKKKQKKTKISNRPPTPFHSRPSTPKPADKAEPEKNDKSSDAPDPSKKSKGSESETASKANDAKGKGKNKAEEPVHPSPPAPTAEIVDENAEKPIPTPSAVLRDLLSHGDISQPDNLAVFKPPVGYNHRVEYQGDLQDLDGKLVITEEDRAALLSGRPVHKVMQGLNRIMLTPNGDCVRNLTPDEEERYLELQSRIFQESGPTAFVPARHNASNGFTLIGGRAVPNGPPAFFPPLDRSQTTAPLDPVSKIQRDEALSYINQYVLPSLSTNSQLERALNANALDAEVLRPADPQTWASWGAGQVNMANRDNRSGQETPYGGNRQDGILASGLESMTAHFGVGRENGRGQPLGNVTLLSLSDSETAMQSAKKETEKLEKSLNQLLKKNRRLLLGAGH